MEFVILFFSLVAVLWKAAIKTEENQENNAKEAAIPKSGGTEIPAKSVDFPVSTPAEWKKKAEEIVTELRDTVNEKEEGAISEAEIRKKFLFGEEKKTGERPSPAEIRDYHEKRLDDEWEKNEQRNAHERMLSAKRFASARTKQSNAGTVHAVHIDSCEGRLESLKVLYDAGILDRTEYQQRVARVKKQHSESRR